MVNFTCNGMRILVVFMIFMKIVTTCSLDLCLFMGIFVCGHFVCRGHCVSQWTQVSIGLKFLVFACAI